MMIEYNNLSSDVETMTELASIEDVSEYECVDDDVRSVHSSSFDYIYTQPSPWSTVVMPTVEQDLDTVEKVLLMGNTTDISSNIRDLVMHEENGSEASNEQEEEESIASSSTTKSVKECPWAAMTTTTQTAAVDLRSEMERLMRAKREEERLRLVRTKREEDRAVARQNEDKRRGRNEPRRTVAAPPRRRSLLLGSDVSNKTTPSVASHRSEDDVSTASSSSQVSDRLCKFGSRCRCATTSCNRCHSMKEWQPTMCRHPRHTHSGAEGVATCRRRHSYETKEQCLLRFTEITDTFYHQNRQIYIKTFRLGSTTKRR